jgi:hypothetical protein
MDRSVVLVGVLAIAGCVEPVSQDIGTAPRIVTNALSPTAFANSALISGVLDATNAAAMGQTSSARKVLAFATTCALNLEQSIEFTTNGVTYHYGGLMGVAPAWTDRALTATEAAWVSACVVSRVNLTSSLVEISARGDNAGYDTTIGEVADYQLEEGAFWGNAFTDLGTVQGFSCNGVTQAADDTMGDLPLRECAEWDGVEDSNASACGFHYAGLCSDVCSTNTAPYTGCSFQGGSASSDVVTTFLYGTP